MVRHNKYKTKLCQKYWIAGYCAYGPRCNFIHQEAMRILASGSMDARGFAVSAGPKAFVSGQECQRGDFGCAGAQRPGNAANN